MGEVLSTTALIRDIADMTSMLSLNASIIAAQAGNRALGFGTVADEIRQLATRTRSAVDGIEQRADDARKQLDAMGVVVQRLSSTVNASRVCTAETTTVLEQVLEQMNGALADVSGLAALISEASESTRMSRDAVGLIEREVTSIGDALARQKSAQARLDDSFAVMRKNAGGVRDTSRQQAQSTDALIEGMQRLARATEELVALSAAQTRSAEGIAQDTSRVQLVSESNRKTVDAITGAVDHLDEEARALREAIQSLQTR
jgi:methyl-accepting chemotaxis protein